MNLITGPLALAFSLLLTSSAMAQGLAFVTNNSAATGPETESQFLSADIAFQAENLPLQRWYGQRGLDVLLGDLNGDGEQQDSPNRIDALALVPGFNDGPMGLALSFSTNFTALDGTLIRDGDVVRFLGGGVVQIIATETEFATATATGAVDVDAFHIGADGSVYFSFSEDETTTSASLIAANGGSASLDEATVFRIGSDGSASIFITRDEAVAFANTATGGSLSTVVDTQGFAADPNHPGEFLLTFGSSNDLIEGRVISTANGGSLFNRGTQNYDSPGFAFETLEILGGIAWVESPPPLVTLHHPADVGPVGTLAQIRVTGLAPGNTVRLVITDTRFPAEPALALGFTGRDAVFIDPGHPFAAVSLSAPEFAAMADANGRADFSYDVSLLPPGLALTLQAFEVETLHLSGPIATIAAP